MATETMVKILSARDAEARYDGFGYLEAARVAQACERNRIPVGVPIPKTAYELASMAAALESVGKPGAPDIWAAARGALEKGSSI